MKKKILKSWKATIRGKEVTLREFIKDTWGSIRIFDTIEEAQAWIEYEKKYFKFANKSEYKIYNTKRG